ncbi:MAG: PAS domain-containing sensor histidine kinase [Anaeromicrobium sp.]|jgi:signal transduction histidine kinase|uniref:sensor histidine kinase n=1 Tax=Anaeromicrobium sp. TaxID=1929132 RepID=UPI0025E5A0B5|nr:PAS domain-containing sensor histidine kinase [Anaeromicrobium sp.]MCT4593641.1 PAS domain-containing sensor histidine kinase [Anaeromicrobium sp.]
MNNKDLLPSIFNNIPVGLIIINEDLKVTDVNDEAIRIFYSENPIGKRDGEVFNCMYNSIQESCGHNLACNLYEIRKIVLDTFKYRVPICDLHISPDLIFNSKLVKPILKFNTRLITFKDKEYVILLIEDLTNTKDNTYKIYLNKIRNYDKIQSELFSNISHELKTPLNLLFSSVQLLEMYSNENKSLNSGTNHKTLDIMKKNCYRLSKTIDNLLDTLKISLGELTIQKESVNIVEVIEKICAFMLPTIKKLNRRFIFTTNLEEKIISIDMDALEKILVNLISNGIKFTRPNDTIIVKLYCRKDNIFIFVKDNGRGIPEDKHDVIFEKFSQVNPILNRYHEGSGLGLSIVKSLVDLLGGNIYVKSKVNNGSTFIVKLPIDSNSEHFNYSDYVPSMDKISASLADIYE